MTDKTVTDLTKNLVTAIPSVDWCDTGLLNRVRFYASKCRAAARQDIERVYSAISNSAELSEEAYMRLLLQILDQALGYRPVFLRPGESMTTFDERWLTTLLRVHSEGDLASVRFLINSRIPKQNRRVIFDLVDRAAERMATAA